MTDDATLLRDYAANRSEKAFAELVSRHLRLVYSAATRRLGGDVHGAADVAQFVFTALARDAAQLSQHAALTAWLYTATRNAAIDIVRSEKRRRGRDQEAHTMQIIAGEAEIPADWEKLKTVLDDVMDGLSDRDREAVLLRFFQGRQFAEIARVLALSEEAARKRVSRALEELGEALRRRGITSTAVALATVLASESVLAVPANLATAVAGAALAGGSAGGVVGAAVTFMTTIKILAGIGAAVVIGGTVALVLQQRTIAQLREADARTQRQVTMLSSESAENVKACEEVEKELTKLRLELVTLKTTGGVGARPTGARGVRTQTVGGAAAVPPVVDAALEKKKASMHRRYDPFFQQRGLTAAQGERMVELKMQQADAREDLQAAVETAGLPGDTEGIEAMRSKLYEPITKELREILGDDGYAAFRDYETTSAFRGAIVEPMSDMFVKINAPLSAEQTEQLVRVLVANKQLRRAKPTDIGSAVTMDWDAVIGQMSGTLTPAQMNVIQTYANRQKAEKR